MRLFVAIELDQALKRTLAKVQRRLEEFSRTVRWTRPEQMHLTLKFLGEVSDDEAGAVCAAAGRVARQVSPFDMKLTTCGCFPPGGAVRIVHLGLADAANALDRCHELCEEQYERIGFARERKPFRPHLTVGRARQDRTGGRLRQAVAETSCEAVAQAVSSISVVQSELLPGGARYTNLVRQELGEPK